MAAAGLVTHVRDAQRSVAWLVTAYIVSFELVGGLAGEMFIALFDPGNTLLANPLGYFLRYGIPVGLIAGAIFARLYWSHAEAVTKALAISPASRFGDARFVRIAEEQCSAQGVRFPRFGIIEVPQPNALAVGDGPSRGMIAVTRGLLDHLDDEELAAVIAHEVAHIRNGDTKVLAANHALMRTAVLLQVNNMLRFEDWRQLLIPLLLPPFMVIMLLSGFITMISMKLAREARRGINLSRDYVADVAAVRATHFPDALISALHKLNGRGGFENSERWEDILFEGRSSGDGGSHPDLAERISALHAHTGSMIDVGRVRRDTRHFDPANPAALRPAGGFGRRGLDAQSVLAARAANITVPAVPPPRQREKPPFIDNNALAKLMFTDFKAYKAYVAQCTDYYEWRENDQRDIFGLRPEMRIPVMACFAFLLVLHWPSDGNYRDFAYKFSPSLWADITQDLHGTHCSGPSYPDGKCQD